MKFSRLLSGKHFAVPTISAKLVGVGAVSQRLITNGRTDVKRSLFRQPASRLLEVVRRKKLDWCAADPCSGKRERRSFPTWLGDDGDLGNLVGMREDKIEIIPIRAGLPAFEAFKNY